MLRPFVCSLIFALPLAALPSPDLDFSGVVAYPDHLEVTNRVLIKINGSQISVMDVVRRMDLLFLQQYPDYLNQAALRYQFYKENWRAFLELAIDDELIKADAKEKKVEVTEGEIRERMQESLGPDVVFTLVKLGLSMDEAIEIIRTELIVRKMKGGLVHARAFAEVNPKSIRERYEKMLKDNPPEARYVYNVLSFKAEREEASMSAAEKAYQLLTHQHLPLDAIKEQFLDPQLAINVSTDYSRTSKEISLAHKAALEKLTNGTFSEPVVKKGVAYIFHLKEFKKPEPPPFAEVAPQIKQELLQEAIVRYDSEYRERLRKRYGMTEQFLSQLIPAETQPFALR